MSRLYTAKDGQVSMFEGAKAQPSSHANRGMDLEKALAIVHDYYARTGIGCIGKQHIPTQIVKGGQWAKVIGKSTVDYVGLMRGGRFVAFDAKECSEQRIELSRLQEHQYDYLKEVERLGGIAFVLVRFMLRGRLPEVYAVPFEAWRWAVEAHEAGQKVLAEKLGWWATGKASINVREMKSEWTVEGVDWEGTVESWTA